MSTVGDFDLVDGILTPFPLSPTQHYELMIEFVSSSGRKTMKKRIPLEHDHYTGYITIRDLPMDEEGFYFFSIYERDRRHSVDAVAPPTYVVRVVDHRTSISHSLEQARDKVTEELRFDRTLINQRGLMYNYYNDQEKNQNDYAIQFHHVGGVGHNIRSFKKVVALVNEDNGETKVFVSFPENVPATP